MSIGTREPLVWLAAAVVYSGVTAAEGPADRSKLPCPENGITRYTAHRVAVAPEIDGRLDEPGWRLAPESARYVDVLTGAPTIHDTRAKILWDDQNLYLGIRVEEPFVRAKFTANNSPIYEENDLEVFIAGPDAYYEFEINALNTTYEVFFLWESAYVPAGFAAAPEFARKNLRPFNGVGFTTHPRGPRLGHFDWHFPGKRTAVFIDGTLNNDSDRDRGWTVELAFPWAGMKWLSPDGQPGAPKDGAVWRIDLSRFNAYKEAAPAKDSGGWFLSPHRVWDSHIPECFPYIRFSTNDVSALKR